MGFSALFWLSLMVFLVTFALPIEFDVNVSLFGSLAPLQPARCSCRPSGESGCRLRRAHISGVDSSVGASIKRHIGRAGDLRVVPFHDATLSCAEDDSTAEIAGSWGGDAGEIVLALAVAEKIREKPLEVAQVEHFVRAYISKSRSPRIYWHTTAQAARWIQAQLEEETLDFARPPQALQGKITAALQDPRGQGCSLLRGLIESPDRFRVRLGLVFAFIGSFHHALWDPTFENREKIQYFVNRGAEYIGKCTTDSTPSNFAPARTAPLPYGRFTAVLKTSGGRLETSSAQSHGHSAVSALLRSAPSGGHAESSCSGPGTDYSWAADNAAAPLLRVHLSNDCLMTRRTPLVASNLGTGKRPFFVTHPDVVAARRNATVPLLVAALPGSDKQQIRNLLHDLGRTWAEAVEGALKVSIRAEVLLA